MAVYSNGYIIVCPSCGREMDDNNRRSTTMLNAYPGKPGGEAYQYVYRCPKCDNKITWTYYVKKPVITIEPWEDEEE